MFWNRFLAPAVVILAVLAYLNWLGGENSLYFTLPWYDVLAHFLGGLGIGLLISWILHVPATTRFDSWKRPWNIITLVFIVGILWEIFELSFGLTQVTDYGYGIDTASDLVMDTVGAFVSVWYSRISHRIKKQ